MTPSHVNLRKVNRNKIRRDKKRAIQKCKISQAKISLKTSLQTEKTPQPQQNSLTKFLQNPQLLPTTISAKKLTNPAANLKISGKKKNILLKRARKDVTPTLSTVLLTQALDQENQTSSTGSKKKQPEKSKKNSQKNPPIDSMEISENISTPKGTLLGCPFK
eukprot:Sdes_comp15730_c0_seq1m4770